MGRMKELREVFDCYNMPKDVKRYFFDHYGEGKSNDVYINVYIEGNCDIEDCVNDYECDGCDHLKHDIVKQWLLDNGATGEKVIVKRWW